MMINRQDVLEKYNNHCAYCGKEIDLKSMQVDHKQPRRSGGKDDFDNLNPSCRRCNHYKGGCNVEGFRRLLNGVMQRLEEVYIYRVALDFGFVIPAYEGGDNHSLEFYFERYERLGRKTVIGLEKSDDEGKNNAKKASLSCC
jgi:hypothetical protein